jgi:hypothetical protein
LLDLANELDTETAPLHCALRLARRDENETLVREISLRILQRAPEELDDPSPIFFLIEEGLVDPEAVSGLLDRRCPFDSEGRAAEAQILLSMGKARAAMEKYERLLQPRYNYAPAHIGYALACLASYRD